MAAIKGNGDKQGPLLPPDLRGDVAVQSMAMGKGFAERDEGGFRHLTELPKTLTMSNGVHTQAIPSKCEHAALSTLSDYRSDRKALGCQTQICSSPYLGTGQIVLLAAMTR
jgi:hypothetical protein